MCKVITFVSDWRSSESVRTIEAWVSRYKHVIGGLYGLARVKASGKKNRFSDIDGVLTSFCKLHGRVHDRECGETRRSCFL